MLIENGVFETMSDEFVTRKAAELAGHLQNVLSKFRLRGGMCGQIVSRQAPGRPQVFWVEPAIPGEKVYPGAIWQIDREGIMCGEVKVTV